MINDHRISGRAIVGLSIPVFIWILYRIISGDLLLLALLFLLPLGILLIIRANYPAIMAFAVLCPFSLPIHYGNNLSIYFMLTAFCLGCWTINTMARGQDSKHVKSIDVPMSVFFIYIALRYLYDPVIPGFISGKSGDVTGFTVWFKYGNVILSSLFLGILINNEQAIKRMWKYLLYFALCYIFLFFPLIFMSDVITPGMLQAVGIHASYYGNNLLRILTLPTFGAIVILLCICRNMIPMRSILRYSFVMIGLIATIAGGSRAIIIILPVAILIILAIQRRWITLVILLCTLCSLVLTFNYLYSKQIVTRDMPGIRMLGIINQQIDRDTDGYMNTEWRYQRWRLAETDIKNNPWFGMGYGGLRDFLQLMNAYSKLPQEYMAEYDVAAGSMHNGYLSAARGIGIPATILFIIIVINRFLKHFTAAFKSFRTDRQTSDTHAFLASVVLSWGLIILIGPEIQDPFLWFFMSMGLIVDRIYDNKTKTVQDPR